MVIGSASAEVLAFGTSPSTASVSWTGCAGESTSVDEVSALGATAVAVFCRVAR
jgi:hypothetical protein